MASLASPDDCARLACRFTARTATMREKLPGTGNLGICRSWPGRARKRKDDELALSADIEAQSSRCASKRSSVRSTSNSPSMYARDQIPFAGHFL